MEDKESCHGCVGADEEVELRRRFRALGYAGERRRKGVRRKSRASGVILSEENREVGWGGRPGPAGKKREKERRGSMRLGLGRRGSRAQKKKQKRGKRRGRLGRD